MVHRMKVGQDSTIWAFAKQMGSESGERRVGESCDDHVEVPSLPKVGNFAECKFGVSQDLAYTL